MDRRRELKEQYKLVKTCMGVIQIMNENNGKIFVGAYPNLKNKWTVLKSQLDFGQFVNAQLQRDWREYGQDAFSYVVLEEKDTEGVADVQWELKQMEKAWLQKLRPFGEAGYNRPPKEA